VDVGVGPAGRAVALLAGRHAVVDRRPRLAARGKVGAGVAGRAPGADRVVGVEAAWVPRGEAGLVAGVAVGRGRGRDERVGDVVAWLAVGGRVGAGMAARALGRDDDLGVVPLGRLPRRHAVAAVAIGRAHRDVRGRLAGGVAAVVAARAV